MAMCEVIGTVGKKSYAPGDLVKITGSRKDEVFILTDANSQTRLVSLLTGKFKILTPFDEMYHFNGVVKLHNCP